MSIKREDLSVQKSNGGGFNVIGKIGRNQVRVMTIPHTVAETEEQAEAALDWLQEGLRSMFEKGEARGIEGQQYALRELFGVPSIQAFDDLENGLRNRIEDIENRM
jgi:hypothetical protein